MKRTIVIVGIILALSVLFVGCGRQQGTTSQPGGPTELTIALWHYTTQPEFENTLNAYTSRNPNITFDIIDTLTSNYVEV